MPKIKAGDRVRVARVLDYGCPSVQKAHLGQTAVAQKVEGGCGECRAHGLIWQIVYSPGDDRPETHSHCVPEECLDKIEDNAREGKKGRCVVAGTVTEFTLWKREHTDAEGEFVEETRLLPAKEDDALPWREGALTADDVVKELLSVEGTRQIILDAGGYKQVRVEVRPFK